MTSGIVSYFIVVIPIALVWMLYKWSVSTFDYWKKKGVVYVEPTVPFFGNILPFFMRRENYPELLDRIYRELDGHRYGGYFEMREPILMIRDPELITTVTIKDFKHFHDRVIEFVLNPDNVSLNPLTDNLFSLKGERWKIVRQKISSVFTTSKLQAMFPAVVASAKRMCQKLSEQLNKGGDVGITNILTDFSLDVVSVCILGVNYLSEDNSEMTSAINKTFKESNILLRFFLMTISQELVNVFRIPDVPMKIREFFETLVEESIRFRETAAGSDRTDFVQTMIDIKNNAKIETEAAAGKFDDKDIKANVFGFFIGGFETIVTGLSFCLHELAYNIEIQEKLRKEIASIRVEFDNEENILQILKDFRYLDMVVSEIYRKYALMPALFRICTEDYRIPGTDHLITKGTKVVIPINSVHRNPEIFPDPETFDPERFSPDNKTKIPSGGYLPFGGGPRFCVGKRFTQLIMKIALIEIISNFSLYPCSKTGYKVECYKSTLFISPKHGIWIKIKNNQNQIIHV